MRLNENFNRIFYFSDQGFQPPLYRTHVTWHTPKDKIQWEKIRLIVALNHTSLFEFLFISAIPNARLWRAIDRFVMPVADVTLQRPLVGFFFRRLIPNAVPITRKRDDSWSQFIDQTGGNSLILIFPEGRMKRRDGLDKHGKPMTVKGGIVEILEKLGSGKMLLAYSGGLHHVQAPGDVVPRIFKDIEIGFEEMDIAEYKKMFSPENFRAAVIADLEERMRRHC